jgi:hypothetical protein
MQARGKRNTRHKTTRHSACTSLLGRHRGIQSAILAKSNDELIPLPYTMRWSVYSLKDLDAYLAILSQGRNASYYACKIAC